MVENFAAKSILHWVSAVASSRRGREATYMYPLALSNGNRPLSHHSLLHTTKYDYKYTVEMHGFMRLLFDLQYLEYALIPV